MSYGELKSTWSSVELNLLLCAFILVKSGCFTDRETLQGEGVVAMGVPPLGLAPEGVAALGVILSTSGL